MAPIIAAAFIGSVLPAFVWLFFWLREDRCQPEPKRYIFYTFLAGMGMVILVLPAEEFLARYLIGFSLIIGWAAIEEIAKFGAAYLAALRTRVCDEPLDAVIYMVTAALGFSALENALFIFTPLYQGDVFQTILVGDLRFIGAMLLHTLASATIGLTLALSFYKPAWMRRIAAVCGVILAITLHSLFNFFILEESGTMLWAFVLIWVGIVITLLLVERVKDPVKDYC